MVLLSRDYFVHLLYDGHPWGKPKHLSFTKEIQLSRSQLNTTGGDSTAMTIVIHSSVYRKKDSSRALF